MFWRLSLPSTYIKFRNIFRNKQFVILVKLVMPRKIPFENMGTGLSSLEILQGPEVPGGGGGCTWNLDPGTLNLYQS